MLFLKLTLTCGDALLLPAVDIAEVRGMGDKTQLVIQRAGFPPSYPCVTESADDIHWMLLSELGSVRAVEEDREQMRAFRAALND